MNTQKSICFILFVLCIGLIRLNAQTYTPISINGFNEDIVANGSGTSANESTTDVIDAAGWVLYSKDFHGANNTNTPAPYGLPSDGIINSKLYSGASFQLADYSNNNALVLKDENSEGTLAFTKPGIYNRLVLLLTSTNGISEISIQIDFTDNTSTTKTSDIEDWYTDNYYTAANGIGRVRQSDDVFSGDALNPRLFIYSIELNQTERLKLVKSVRITKTSVEGNAIIMGVSGRTGFCTQTFSAIPITGFNYDGIAEGSGGANRALSTTTASLDLQSMVMYAKSFRGNENTSVAPPFGLPNNGIITSASNTNTSYQLANYAGPNVMLIKQGEASGTISLVNPSGYERISILYLRTEISSSVNVILKFDNSFTYSRNFWFYDEYNGKDYAMQGIGLVNQNTDVFTGDADNPRLYEIYFDCENSPGRLESITFTPATTNGYTAILAVSGVEFKPLTFTGFNADVIANGSGGANRALYSTSEGLDIGSNVFYSKDFRGDLNPSSEPVYGLPDNGIITSEENVSNSYQLRNYNTNNALVLKNQDQTGTLNLANPGIFKELAILATSPQGLSTVKVSLHFDDLSSSEYTVDIADWYNGDFPAIQGIGRVKRTNDNFDGEATNPRLYDIFLKLNASESKKVLNQISITKLSVDGNPIILAVNGKTATNDLPVALPASDISSDKFTAKWNKVAGAKNYRLDVAYDPAFQDFVPGYMNKEIGNVALYEVLSLDPETTYYYQVRAENFSGQSANSNTISARTTNTLSVPTIKSSSINIYPTITEDLVYIKGVANAEITVYDINGKQLLRTKEQQLQLRHLGSGIYIVKVQTKTDAMLSRVIVK